MSHTATPTTATKRRLLHGRRTAATLIAAATLTMANGPLTGLAEASTITWDHTYDGVGVQVKVKEYGDIIEVCDTSANGHAAWATIRDETYRFYVYGLTDGGDSGCDRHRASDGNDYDLYEGNLISIEYDGTGGTSPYGGDYRVEFRNDH